MNKKEILEISAAQEDALTKEELKEAKATISKELPGNVGDYAYDLLNTAQGIPDSATDHSGVVVFTHPTASKTNTTEAAGKGKSAEANTGMWYALKTKIRKVMDDDLSSELFKNKLINHLPKVMFILLPLFALILMLVNRKSSAKFYVEHLIYSIHVHSFLFLFASVLIVLGWLLPFLSDWIDLLGLVVILWYIYRSMRNMYNSSRWRTIYKFFLLSFAYSLLMFLSSSIVALAILYTM